MSDVSLGLSLPLRLGKSGFFETNKDTFSQIRDNIINLLSTKPNERRFNNDVANPLYSVLYEQMEYDVNKNIIHDTIQRAVNDYIGGVTITNIEVNKNDTNYNQNSIFISITFEYNGNTDTVTITLSE